MPDLTFSDLEDLAQTTSVSAVVLPENKQCLTRLETDPRLHNFLRRVLAQGGHIVMGDEGRQFLKKISVGDFGLLGSNNGSESLLLIREFGQSIQGLARDLIDRMGNRYKI